MAILANLQPRGQFAMETVSGMLPRFSKIHLYGLTAGQVNYIQHGLPVGAVPIAVDFSPGITNNGLWTESQPADATPPTGLAITSVAASVSSVAVYTGTIPDGAATSVVTLTAAAAAAGGVTVYTGTVTGGANNTFAGQWFNVTGFDNSANNGLFLCVGSSATTLTLVNGSGAADTHAGTATTGGYIGSYFTIAGFGNSANNGTFQCSGQTAATLTLSNASAVAQTATAATIVGGFLYLEVGSTGAVYGSAYLIY